MGAEALPNIIQPFIFESLEWLRCGMTTASATAPGEPRLQFAARLPEIAELTGAGGFEAPPVIVGEQIHGDRIAVVGGEANEAGDYETGEVVEIPGVDALTTSERQVVVGIFTADCVPVVLVDPRRRAVAAIHAGRQGTLKGIVGKTMEKLRESGTNPQDCLAWIGPSVCCAHYEVSEEIAAEFRDHFAHYPGIFHGPENRNLALGVLNWCELIAAGLPMERMELDARCTYENEALFHSHRRDPSDKGRMLTYACIRTAGVSPAK